MNSFGAWRRTTATTKSFVRLRSISTRQISPVPTLPDAALISFRDHAFKPGLPFLLPSGHFTSLPAASRWFKSTIVSPARTALNIEYLAPYSATNVPLEATTRINNGETSFARAEQPLAIFLAYMNATNGGTTSNSSTGSFLSLYLAQCPLPTLPADLFADVPTPAFVTSAGRGDVYDSSIWIGAAPTYTPLHRDPNPNLFVQLAGRKIVRIFEPAVGSEIFAEARRRIGDASGGRGGTRMRGEEMMAGAEKTVLEELVWGEERLGANGSMLGQEASLDSGDGMFIPKGWWHSVKGVGDGVVGSVNWWFR